MSDRTSVGRDIRNLEVPSVPASAKGRERQFRIAAQAWIAYEATDPCTQTTTLIFFGPGTARRIRSYPSNWRDLSDVELYALSWER